MRSGAAPLQHREIPGPGCTRRMKRFKKLRIFGTRYDRRGMTVRELCALLDPEENGDRNVFVRAEQFVGATGEAYDELVIRRVEARMEPDTAVMEMLIHCEFSANEYDDD